MKKISAALVLTFLFANISFSQLADFNTHLIKHLNPRPTSFQYKYSACWGYTAPDGREYAIIGCQPGTSFIDITDSSGITEVGFVAGSTSEWREMKVYSHYAYIVSEASNSGVQIVDLQYLPDSVHYVKKFSAPSHSRTHSISQSGPYLYLNGANSSFVGNGGIAILDLSVDPENPVLRGKWTTDYVHDCRVLNDTIWASNIYTGKTSIINATNKTSLSTIRTFNSYPISTISTHNCALTTDRNYLYTTNEIDNPPGQLFIWNVQDLNSISFVGQWQPTGLTTTIVHNVEIYGNYAVVAHYTAGIRVLDISNPVAPVEVAWYDTYKRDNTTDYLGCWGVFMFPSGKIIGSDTDSGLYVIKTDFTITGTGTGGYTSSIVPEKYSLDQNFPNPFNPSTKISFSLPSNSNVTLNIYSTSGKQVAELLNDRRDAGNYEVNFDASKYGLSSGVYYYTFKANGFSETKKMLMIK
ncbi:MAG TPA: choice-of-anchor B family protein [Ignavibacteria bacterium]|nr:choice-of-anchor B family protein [Ignavibacteria bacterium]HMR39986.1 choice-of-anchor B family protein [Ignavibacteria bacterium]